MNILSLGVGLQSSTMLLMALHGEFDWFPDAAIFADTHSEADHVYKHLEYLEAIVGRRFPIYRVSAGSLEQDILGAVTGKNKRVGNAPFHVINRETLPDHTADLGGMLWRSCTKDYKLNPLRKKTRELYLASGKKQITQYIGISLDEMERMKDSRVKYITNVYPLVDAGITRHDCELWLRRNGYNVPGKSACHFCPYRSNRAWAEMKRTDPETFERSCDFDDALRANGGRLPGVTGEVYVHRSFMPLRMVDLTTAEDHGQGRLFPELIEECEGMCGV